MSTRDPRNWKLVCDGGDGCEQEWGGTIKLDAIALHFDIEHEGRRPIAFRTVWTGPGAAPAQPDNRAERRRQERHARRRH